MVKCAVLGATGRTGRLVVAELAGRGHDVRALVRETSHGGSARGGPAALPEDTATTVGDARDPEALRRLVSGVDVVISALGPVKDATLHRDVTPILIGVMRGVGVARFVGVSGAGIDVPGDAKSRRDRIISGLLQRVGGQTVRDKALEYAAWAASGLEWTLVRPPRLIDGPATGRVEHDAHRSVRSTSITRGDLAAFLVDVAEQGTYVGQAPLVGGR